MLPQIHAYCFLCSNKGYWDSLTLTSPSTALLFFQWCQWSLWGPWTFSPVYCMYMSNLWNHSGHDHSSHRKSNSALLLTNEISAIQSALSASIVKGIYQFHFQFLFQIGIRRKYCWGGITNIRFWLDNTFLYLIVSLKDIPYEWHQIL